MDRGDREWLGAVTGGPLWGYCWGWDLKGETPSTRRAFQAGWLFDAGFGSPFKSCLCAPFFSSWFLKKSWISLVQPPPLMWGDCEGQKVKTWWSQPRILMPGAHPHAPIHTPKWHVFLLAIYNIHCFRELL